MHPQPPFSKNDSEKSRMIVEDTLLITQTSSADILRTLIFSRPHQPKALHHETSIAKNSILEFFASFTKSIRNTFERPNNSLLRCSNPQA